MHSSRFALELFFLHFFAQMHVNAHTHTHTHTHTGHEHMYTYRSTHTTHWNARMHTRAHVLAHVLTHCTTSNSSLQISGVPASMTSASLALCLEVALGGCEVRNVRVVQSTRAVGKRGSHDGCDDGSFGAGDGSATMRGRGSTNGRRAFAECALPPPPPSSSSSSPSQTAEAATTATAAVSTSSSRGNNQVSGSTSQVNGVVNIEVRLDVMSGDILACRVVSTEFQGPSTACVHNGWQHPSTHDMTRNGPVHAKRTSAQVNGGDEVKIRKTPQCGSEGGVVTCVLRIRPLPPTVIGVLRAVVSEHGLGGLYV